MTSGQELEQVLFLQPQSLHGAIKELVWLQAWTQQSGKRGHTYTQFMLEFKQHHCGYVAVNCLTMYSIKSLAVEYLFCLLYTSDAADE